jgi:outer membrane protein TolC
MKHKSITRHLSLLFLLFCSCQVLRAQETATYSLTQLTDSALKNSHTLAGKDWQIKERSAKIAEDKIKKYPSVDLNGNYLHNFVLDRITIPAGTIGDVQISPGNNVLLPSTDKTFKAGKYNTYLVGVSVYQPITQQLKINTGIEVDKQDRALVEKEKEKLSLQLKLGIEKLYYGALIARKKLEEAQAKLELARSQFDDVESALLAGKTIQPNRSGLQADIADQEQNILKLNIQVGDYISDLINLTGISSDSLKLQGEEPMVYTVDPVHSYISAAMTGNTDLQMAKITKSKALLGIKAARQANLPDLGVVGGYMYQSGNSILPADNPYLGVNLKWNLQDLFSNKAIEKQRQAKARQADENIAGTRQQLTADVEKAYRKVNESLALISVAQKAVIFRQQEMKLLEDKQAAGLVLKQDILSARSQLARSESDLYSAQLSYRLAVSDLNFLTGQ